MSEGTCILSETLLSNSVLVEVFSYLDVVSLGRAAQVCRRWRDVAQYDTLWKQLAMSIWKVSDLPPGQVSWQQEMKRLLYHVPMIESVTIDEHRDEVLDVTVSHNGSMICTCCNDGIICLWDVFTLSKIHQVDTARDFGWESAQTVLFNESDTLLLVCGVQCIADYKEGIGVVLLVQGMRRIFEIDVDPYTLAGAWLTDRVLVAGKFEGGDVIKIVGYEVTDAAITSACETWLATIAFLTHEKSVTLLQYGGLRHHQMNLLIASMLDTCAQNISDLHSVSGGSDSAVSMATGTSPTVNCSDSLGDDMARRYEHGKQNCDSVFGNSLQNTCDKPSSSLDKNTNCDNMEPCAKQSGAHTKCKHAHKLESSEAAKCNMNPQYQLKSLSKTYMAVVTGAHDVIGLHEIKQADVDAAFAGEHQDDLQTLEKLDHMYHLEDCYITGMCLSYEQNRLFFNYRQRDKTHPFDEAIDTSQRVYCEEIKIGTIDLVTMEMTKVTGFSGHRAFSTSPLWFICLASSKDFLGSGGEDAKAYIWDRHHQALVARLPHREGVVNGIAFCPNDQEICLTVCDDCSIKVWVSRRRLDERVAKVSHTA